MIIIGYIIIYGLHQPLGVCSMKNIWMCQGHVVIIWFGVAFFFVIMLDLHTKTTEMLLSWLELTLPSANYHYWLHHHIGVCLMKIICTLPAACWSFEVVTSWVFVILPDHYTKTTEMFMLLLELTPPLGKWSLFVTFWLDLTVPSAMTLIGYILL